MKPLVMLQVCLGSASFLMQNVQPVKSRPLNSSMRLVGTTAGCATAVPASARVQHNQGAVKFTREKSRCIRRESSAMDDGHCLNLVATALLHRRAPRQRRSHPIQIETLPDDAEPGAVVVLTGKALRVIIPCRERNQIQLPNL